jgi:hypothetical protein
MRQRYFYRNGNIVDRDGFPMLSHNELAHDESQIRAPMVMRDIEPYRSPIDDRWITSRSWRREDLKANNCVEADPPKRKRGYVNPTFAKKQGVRVCEESIEAQRHRKDRKATRIQKDLDAMWSLNSEYVHDVKQVLERNAPRRRRKRVRN